MKNPIRPLRIESADCRADAPPYNSSPSSSRIQIPFLRPDPPKLSQLLQELEAIEKSGIFSNYGPVSAKFEAALTARIFGGRGGCLTVNNATTGLMIAIRESATPKRQFALMPSFTFAATAHAALWAGLTPLLCDINANTWNASADAEDELLSRYGEQVGCIVPYACFGNNIDLGRYERLARDRRVGIVVDAAASLGSMDAQGRGFGAGFPHAIVYSMHATKTFATGEAGVIHCGDGARLSRLRSMGNFGFGRPREATMPGLNAKLTEVGSLLGLAKLDRFEQVVQHRNELAAMYRENLPGFQFQCVVGHRLAYQFMPVLLPPNSRVSRSEVTAELQATGIGAAHYFSPHVAEHSYFAEVCVAGDLSVTRDVARRALSLPMSDNMTAGEALEVCRALRGCVGELAK